MAETTPSSARLTRGPGNAAILDSVLGRPAAGPAVRPEAAAPDATRRVIPPPAEPNPLVPETNAEDLRVQIDPARFNLRMQAVERKREGKPGVASVDLSDGTLTDPDVTVDRLVAPHSRNLENLVGGDFKGVLDEERVKIAGRIESTDQSLTVLEQEKADYQGEVVDVQTGMTQAVAEVPARPVKPAVKKFGKIITPADPGDPGRPAVPAQPIFEKQYDPETAEGVKRAKAHLGETQGIQSSAEQKMQEFLDTEGKGKSYDSEVDLLNLMRLNTSADSAAIDKAIEDVRGQTNVVQKMMAEAANIRLTPAQIKQGHNLDTPEGIAKYLSSRIADSRLVEYEGLRADHDRAVDTAGEAEERYNEATQKALRWEVDGRGREIGEGFADMDEAEAMIADLGDEFVQVEVVGDFLAAHYPPSAKEKGTITEQRLQIGADDRAITEGEASIKTLTELAASQGEPENKAIIEHSITTLKASTEDKRAKRNQLLTAVRDRLDPMKRLSGAKAKVEHLDDAGITDGLREYGVEVDAELLADIKAEVGERIDGVLETMTAEGSTVMGSPDEFVRRVLNISSGRAETDKLVGADQPAEVPAAAAAAPDLASAPDLGATPPASTLAPTPDGGGVPIPRPEAGGQAPTMEELARIAGISTVEAIQASRNLKGFGEFVHNIRETSENGDSAEARGQAKKDLGEIAKTLRTRIDDLKDCTTDEERSAYIDVLKAESKTKFEGEVLDSMVRLGMTRDEMLKYVNDAIKKDKGQAIGIFGIGVIEAVMLLGPMLESKEGQAQDEPQQG